MTRSARTCCGTVTPRKKRKETAIPEPIQSELNRIGGIGALAARLPKDKDLETMSRVYHALSDPLSLRVLHLIRDQPLCVCVIREFIGIADSKLSYHLTILKEAGLIEGEYCGNWIIYSITVKGQALIGKPEK